MNNKQVAQTIVNQLGGAGRLTAMINAKGFMVLDKEDAGVKFNFSGNRKINQLQVVLNADDTYTVSFIKFTAPRKIRNSFAMSEAKWETVKEYKGVYADMLIDLFEDTTGLYLTL